MSLLSSIGRKITDLIGVSHNQPAPQPQPPQPASRMSVGVAQPQGQVFVGAPVPQQRMSVAPAIPQMLRVGNSIIPQTSSIRPAPPVQASGVGQIVGQAGREAGGFLTSLRDIAGMPVEGVREGVAAATHNKPALAAATQRANQGADQAIGFARFAPQLAYKVGESINPVGGDVYQRSHTPTGGLEKFLLGNDPIPSMQNEYNTVKQQYGGNAAKTHAVIQSLMAASLAKGGAEKADTAYHYVQDHPLNEVGSVGKGVNEPIVPKDEAKLNQLAKVNSGSQGNELMQHGAAMNDYLFSKSPFATAEDVAKAKAGMAAQEGIDAPAAKGKPKVALIPSPEALIKEASPDGLTKSELAAGDALGMSRKDILAAKNANGLETAFQARTKGMTAQDLADLSPKEQMALADYGRTTLAPQEVNTARNPHTSLVADVAPGDHAAAISNSQVVSRPIDTARGLWEHSMTRLAPAERANFWRATENPTNASHSPAMQEAISRWRQADNMVHANSQALGGNTNYLTDHALHPWQLPEEFTQHLINGGSPKDFKGLNNISRKYRTIAEGEANGLRLGTDPIKEGSNYLAANSSILRKVALKQGLEMADSGATSHPLTRDLGNGHTVQLSREGFDATKGVAYSPKSANPIVRGLRSANQFTKGTILSLGQFHPINIGVRAAATLVEKGHPIEAAKGLYGTFRGAFGTEYADRVIGKAMTDGTVEKAAQIGMPYGAPHEGATLGRGIGSNTVFNKQMPMMHDAVARSIIADLEKRGVDLSSSEARAAGEAGSKIMGEINTETMNIPPKVSHALSDVMIASKYTHSKFSQLKDAADLRNVGTVGGGYARANVAANVISTAAIIVGVGYLGNQQSDSVRDSILRALVDPAIPTPMKDKKGNTVKLRLPGTDTSDLAKLVGIKLVRNGDGHLGVNWNPKNLPTGVEDFARARLAPWLSTGVKLGTNTSFASKPMYDPNAPAGVKAQQAGTSVAQGLLPIGLQGLPNTEAIKKHLPQGVQEVLDANAPGGNPLVKSLGSSFGVTPTTDMTTGKGLDTSRYFSALDEAKSGLNRQEKDALDLYTGSKKNPVTGKYDVQPSVQDTSAKAKVLLQNPKAVGKLVEMNKKLSDLGQSVDPLWQQPTDKITKYLQYQTMPPGGADRSHWITQNQSWYAPLSDSRNAFFDKLPPGDPNKPAAPIEFPTASPDVAAKQKTFFGLPDSQTRAKYLTENPEVQTQLDKQVEYNNQMRQAQGYSALDTFPKANPQVQKVIDTYNALPKNDGPKGGNKTRSLWIQNHPNDYAAMTQYFTQSSLYGLEQSAGQAQFKDTGFDQKGLKDIYSLGQNDVQKLTDANGNTFYALGDGGGGGGTYTINGKKYAGSSSGSSGGSSKYGPGSYRYNQAVYDSRNPYKYSIDLSTGGGSLTKPKVSVKTASSKSKVASRGGSSKPKVMIKRSLA